MLIKLKGRVDDFDFVETHLDMLDSCVESDGENIEGGVGAGDREPGIITFTSFGTKSFNTDHPLRHQDNNCQSQNSFHHLPHFHCQIIRILGIFCLTSRTLLHIKFHSFVSIFFLIT